jgi:hypothetical protein
VGLNSRVELKTGDSCAGFVAGGCVLDGSASAAKAILEPMTSAIKSLCTL